MLAVLHMSNNSISKDELHHLEIGGKNVIYSDDLPKNEVIAVIHDFLRLLNAAP
jgi:hypothetical protein